MYLSIPLTPKKPGPLQVVTIGRISTEHQDIENIEAMHEEVERFIKQSYDGEVFLKKLGERASGMIIDRQTILEAQNAITTGNWDLVIVEDLARVYRNTARQIAFVHTCVDSDTRFISLGDNIDTADDTWEMSLSVATVRHGMYIPDTRRRVKRTATHAFHNGGMVTVYPYGFQKLTKEQAESGDLGPRGLRIARLPECTPIIREMADRLHQGQSSAEIADWLNESGVKPGKYSKYGKWTSKLVREFLRNPLLHGERTFRTVLYNLEYRTGKKRRVHNKPDQIERELYPELAHLSPEEHAALIAELDARGAKCTRRRGAENGRYRIPRSRTVFPRQHCVCGVCGSFMYPVDGDALRCSRAKDGSCWNRVRPKEAIVRTRVIEAVLTAAKRHPDFEERLLTSIHHQVSQADRKSDSQLKELEGRRDEHSKRIDNLLESIEGGNSSPDSIISRIEKLELEKKDLEEQIVQHERARLMPTASISNVEIEDGLPRAIKELIQTSFEFAALMRRLIPTFIIDPVQALNCSQVRARARFMISWSSLVSPDQAKDLNSSNGQGEWVTVDLFEQPQHIQDALDLRAAVDDGDLRSLVPKQLGMSRERALRARRYLEAMKNAGMMDPYIELKGKPANASRWRKGNRKREAEGL